MSACQYGSMDMARFLVENGADVNAKMVTGWTALFTTVKKGDSDAFNYLMEKRAHYEGRLIRRDNRLLQQLINC